MFMCRLDPLKGCFCLIFIAILAVSAQAKVGPVPIEHMIKSSDLIVVGKVSKTHDVGGVEFANVEILQTLKSNPHTTLTYSAERTWPCDMSDAVETETALFFFKTYEIGPSFRRNSEQAVLFKESVAKIFNIDDLFRLAYDGRGRMPITLSGGERNLSINPSVIMPKGLGNGMTEIIDFTSKVLADS